MAKIGKETKGGLKREYLPIVIAILILGLLITALVYTITYKPEIQEPEEPKYTMNVDELVVNTSNLTCDNKYIDEAKKVQATYEVVDNYYLGKTDELESDLNGDGELTEIDYYGSVLKIVFTGLPDDMFIIVSNDLDEEQHIFRSEDVKDGKIEFIEIEAPDIRTYDVKVVAGTEECSNVLYREFTFKVPMVNMMYNTTFCTNHRDLDICGPYTFEEDYDELKKNYENVKGKELEKEDKAKEQEETKNIEIVEEIKKNYIYIIIAIVVILVIVGVLVVRRRMKNEKK